MAVQTPKQRLANQKWAKNNEKKLGKPRHRSRDQKPQSPLSKPWIIALVFLLVGGGLLELFSRLF